MHEIGRIKLVQVQRSSLKAGQRPYRYYDPSPLVPVERLLLSPGGAIGMTVEGERVVDIHHAEHSESKNQQGLNGISIGFTSHYRAMRERFGLHLVDGCAGENILVESDRELGLPNLGTALIIRTADEQLVRLTDLLVAAPCVEFSQFAAGAAERLPAEAMKATLQFLDEGMRGFYARLADQQAAADVRAGDVVYIEA